MRIRAPTTRAEGGLRHVPPVWLIAPLCSQDAKCLGDFGFGNLNFDSAERVRPQPVKAYRIFICEGCIDLKGFQFASHQVGLIRSTVRPYGDQLVWHWRL